MANFKNFLKSHLYIITSILNIIIISIGVTISQLNINFGTMYSQNIYRFTLLLYLIVLGFNVYSLREKSVITQTLNIALWSLIITTNLLCYLPNMADDILINIFNVSFIYGLFATVFGIYLLFVKGIKLPYRLLATILGIGLFTTVLMHMVIYTSIYIPIILLFINIAFDFALITLIILKKATIN